ncbi:MAG: glycine cleavage system protein GcvH [Deltaproteobacteria bacterium]|nr:glycine cleavage system protein GcvH [Deltaproteobacteria bacterium]
MSIPEHLRYTKDHEWAAVDGDIATIGITDYAQDSLGEIVYVELPEVGAEVKAGETFGVVESVKAVSDLYAPVSGTVSEINGALADAPETINNDPYGDGWMIKVTLADAAETGALMSPEAYTELVAQESAE